MIKIETYKEHQFKPCCGEIPETVYGLTAWEYKRCRKCGRRSKSYNNDKSYIKAVDEWNRRAENAID